MPTNSPEGDPGQEHTQSKPSDTTDTAAVIQDYMNDTPEFRVLLKQITEAVLQARPSDPKAFLTQNLFNQNLKQSDCTDGKANPHKANNITNEEDIKEGDSIPVGFVRLADGTVIESDGAGAEDLTHDQLNELILPNGSFPFNLAQFSVA